MQVLSPSDYDSAQLKAQGHLPSSAVAAFAEATPHQGQVLLNNYVDPIPYPHMTWVEKHLGTLSPNEFDILQHMFGLQLDFCERIFNQTNFARTSSLPLVALTRLLSLVPLPAGSHVLLLGDHCGYATVLLRLLGFSSVSVEWRRPQYLFQNNFMSFNANQQLCETAHLPRLEGAPIDLGPAVHLPWWHLVQLESCPLGRFPLVVASSVLFDLPTLAQGFVIGAIARCMVRESNGSSVLLIPDWAIMSPEARTAAHARMAHFDLLLTHCTDGAAYVAPANSHLASKAREHAYNGETVWQAPGNPISDTAVNLAAEQSEWRIIPGSQIDTIAQLIFQRADTLSPEARFASLASPETRIDA